MKQKKVLITGIMRQDGAYLSKLLLEKIFKAVDDFERIARCWL